MVKCARRVRLGAKLANKEMIETAAQRPPHKIDRLGTHSEYEVSFFCCTAPQSLTTTTELPKRPRGLPRFKNEGSVFFIYLFFFFLKNSHPTGCAILKLEQIIQSVHKSNAGREREGRKKRWSAMIAIEDQTGGTMRLFTKYNSSTTTRIWFSLPNFGGSLTSNDFRRLCRPYSQANELI